jgi:hypothetical protein
MHLVKPVDPAEISQLLRTPRPGDAPAVASHAVSMGTSLA